MGTPFRPPLPDVRVRGPRTTGRTVPPSDSARSGPSPLLPQPVLGPSLPGRGRHRGVPHGPSVRSATSGGRARVTDDGQAAIRVFLLDDHEIVRRGVADVLDSDPL